MEDKKEKPKRKHCKCGKFAVVGGTQCVNCARLQYLEIKIRDLKSCKIQNKELKQTVSGLKGQVKVLEHRKESPIILTIHEKTWSIDQEYLAHFLRSIAPVADALVITWKRK